MQLLIILLYYYVCSFLFLFIASRADFICTCAAEACRDFRSEPWSPIPFPEKSRVVTLLLCYRQTGRVQTDRVQSDPERRRCEVAPGLQRRRRRHPVPPIEVAPHPGASDYLRHSHRVPAAAAVAVQRLEDCRTASPLDAELFVVVVVFFFVLFFVLLFCVCCFFVSVVVFCFFVFFVTPLEHELVVGPVAVHASEAETAQGDPLAT